MRGLGEIGAVYLHRETVDFLKSINGLSVIVEQQMDLSPYLDAVFVFCNKRRDKIKVLYWDKTGFCLWHKRLEQDKFQWPRKVACEVLELSAEQLDWLFNQRTYGASSEQHPNQGQLFDEANQALAFIQKLYEIEKSLKDKPPDERYHVRQQQAEQAQTMVKEKSARHTTQISLGKSVRLCPKTVATINRLS